MIYIFFWNPTSDEMEWYNSYFPVRSVHDFSLKIHLFKLSGGFSNPVP
jgi:hypothetical protein